MSSSDSPRTEVRPKWKFARMLGKILWVLINIPLLGIPALIVTGPRYLWENFFSFALGTFKRDKKTGEVLWIRFVQYPDPVHFHWVILGSLVLAALLALTEGTSAASVVTPFGVSVTWVVLGLIALLAVFRDTPFYSFLKLLGVIALIIGADFGVRLGMEKLDALFDGLPARYGGWGSFFDIVPGIVPELLKRGVIAPIWDVVEAINPRSDAGFLLTFAILSGLGVARVVVLAVLRARKEIDRQNLYEYSFGEKEVTEPIYMRRSSRVIADIFEAMSSFCDYTLMVQGGQKTFKNVFGGAWWLRRAFDDLRQYETPVERQEAEKLQIQGGDDAATLVRAGDGEHEAEESHELASGGDLAGNSADDDDATAAAHH